MAKSDDDTPRPHVPTTEPLERRRMAASWVRVAADAFEKLGDVERAERLRAEVKDVPD